MSELVTAAADGDAAAWGAIVERFSAIVWSVTRSHGLSGAEAADVTQTTWLRLVENLDRIQDPERLAGWLGTTARRESLRTIRLRKRELSTDEDWVFEGASHEELDSGLLTRERDRALWRAFAMISERCQVLLRLLAGAEPPSYAEIGAMLGIPIGAIGPTRGRCLEKLRQSLATEAPGEVL